MPVASLQPDSIERKPKSPGRVYLPNPIEAASPEPVSYADDDSPQCPDRRSTFTRHFPSFQEHADAMSSMVVSAEGEVICTPQQGWRRESFAWGMPAEQATPKLTPLSSLRSKQATTPSSPTENVTHSPIQEDVSQARKPSSTSSYAGESHPSSARLSAGSTFTTSLSRTDTGRSSLSSFVRGLLRHSPDMRMFSEPEKGLEGGNDSNLNFASNESQKPRKHRRRSSAQALSSIKKDLPHEPPKPEPTPTKSIDVLPPQPIIKGGLKDRRKLKHTESLKLTIPPELLTLPIRHRVPAVQISGVAASRPRSPPAPSVHSNLASWQPQTSPESSAVIEEGIQNGHGLLPGSDPIVSSQDPHSERPSPRSQNRYHISRPRFRRHRSGTSESTLSQTTDGKYTSDELQILQEHEERTREELSELGRQNSRARSRRWRLNGPWTSNDLPSIDSPSHELETPNDRFQFHFLKKYKRAVRISDQAISKPSSPNSHPWCRKRPESSPPTFEQTLANMPVPPSFVPPGLNRVVTPQMFDTQSELSGKLAGFFFDTQGVASQKSKPSPGGIWDSDVLLMPSRSNISPKEDSDESPQGPSSLVPTQLDFDQHMGIGSPLVIDGNGYLTIKPPTAQHQQTPRSDDLFRVKQGQSSNDPGLAAMLLKADEKAKFEWLVPEHLPNSPLCPLHEKYHGPCKGACYWHDQTQSNNSTRKSSTNMNKKGRSSYVADGTDEDDDDGRYGWDRAYIEGARIGAHKHQLVNEKARVPRRLGTQVFGSILSRKTES